MHILGGKSCHVNSLESLSLVASDSMCAPSQAFVPAKKKAFYSPTSHRDLANAKEVGDTGSPDISQGMAILVVDGSTPAAYIDPSSSDTNTSSCVMVLKVFTSF